MNFLGGGERHSSAASRSPSSRYTDADTASPGDLAFLEGRPGDVRGFVHKRIFGGIKGAIGGILGGPGGILGGALGGFLGGGRTVPAATGCPPGFLSTGAGCVPMPRVGGAVLPVPGVLGAPLRLGPGGRDIGEGAFPAPTAEQERLRRELGRATDPAAGVAVMGRFGAGFEPEVIATDTRRCGRGAVLGIDGLCYNRRDLRNSDRFWPRGRRPLLTGGEVRAISVASSAAKKLERKQKQLMELGLLKRPTRSRRAAPPGHRATLTHDGGSQH